MTDAEKAAAEKAAADKAGAEKAAAEKAAADKAAAEKATAGKAAADKEAAEKAAEDKKKLDPGRVKKWAELAAEDPEAAKILIDSLVGNELAELRQGLADERNLRLRAELTAKYKIPADYADLITGSTPEAMTASAEKLGKLAAVQAAGGEGTSGGNGRPDPKDPLAGYDPKSGVSKEDFLEQQFIQTARQEWN